MVLLALCVATVSRAGSFGAVVESNPALSHSPVVAIFQPTTDIAFDIHKGWAAFSDWNCVGYPMFVLYDATSKTVLGGAAGGPGNFVSTAEFLQNDQPATSPVVVPAADILYITVALARGCRTGEATIGLSYDEVP
jgi:hypothetical protein